MACPKARIPGADIGSQDPRFGLLADVTVRPSLRTVTRTAADAERRAARRGRHALTRAR